MKMERQKIILIFLAFASLFLFFQNFTTAEPQVTGQLEGFTADADGHPLLNGWTCAVNRLKPLSVDLYLYAPYSPSAESGQFQGRYIADLESSIDLSGLCQTGGQKYKFQIALSQVTPGVPVYVYAVSPDLKSSILLPGSGEWKVPANSLQTLNPGSVQIKKGFVIYDPDSDTHSDCKTALSSAVTPLTWSTGQAGSFEMRFQTSSRTLSDRNYWIKGTFTTSGQEISPLRVDCGSAEASGLSHVFKTSDGSIASFGIPQGYLKNTNVIKNADGFYYTLATAIKSDGTLARCPLRSHNLNDANGWQAWDGRKFNKKSSSLADCADVDLGDLLPSYLGYNTFFKKFISVGIVSTEGSKEQFGYALSQDLIHWSQPVVLAPNPFEVQSDGWIENTEPSLVDFNYLKQIQDANASSGAITGQSPWLTFIQHRGPNLTRWSAAGIIFSQ